MNRSDKKALATLKRAVFTITGKELPPRRELDGLGQKAAIAVGRARAWTGNYLYILLNSEKINRRYHKRKYRITKHLLKGICSIAGIGQEDESPLRQREGNMIIDGSNSPTVEKPGKPENKSETQLSDTIMRRIKNKIKRGFGQGEGKDYVPWLTVREVPSHGLSHRIFGYITQRMHTFFSTLEKKYFLWAEYFLDVNDIREQFPLWIEETIKIAQLLGIRHPVSPKTHEPTVMTSDFVFTIQKGMEKRLSVRSVKPSSELEKRRVLEKLEIEEYYWRSRNIDWAIVTEKELPNTIISNIELLRGYMDIRDRIQLTPEEIKNICMELRKLINQTRLKAACRECDEKFGVKHGTSQVLAFHFMATKKWNVDLTIPIALDHRLMILDNPNA